MFRIPGNENNKCTIHVVTNSYRMGIDNLDIKLVVQWDFSLLFDSMIQWMRAVQEEKEAKQPFCFLSLSSQRLKIKKKSKNKSWKTLRM